VGSGLGGFEGEALDHMGTYFVMQMLVMSCLNAEIDTATKNIQKRKADFVTTLFAV
jgi:hypothetical protein